MYKCFNVQAVRLLLLIPQAKKRKCKLQKDYAVQIQSCLFIQQGGCFLTDPVPRECPQMTTRLFPARALTQLYM